jgi:hypothetical protein
MKIFQLLLAFIFLKSTIIAQNVGIGTLTPSAKLEVNGQIKITGGTPGANKVLTSNADGLATWQTPQTPAAEVAYIYNVSNQIVAIEDDILFDSNGSITSGFSHVAGSSDIAFLNSGTYKVTFSVSASEPNQFGLFINGSSLSESIYGSGAGTQQNTGMVVFTAFIGDVLSLRNHTSAAAVTLASFTGGTQSNVNASILIEKL